MIARLKDFPFRFPVLSSILLGAFSMLAMPPTSFWPALMIGFSIMIVLMGRVTNPWKGAWCVFGFGMGFFTLSLWWIVNALMIDIEVYWWAMGFSILGLPVLLSICWFIAGWLTIRFSRPQSFERAILFITLLALAEYGRAFNLTGFPWNLFGYIWINIPPLAQLAALGGAYFVTVVTMYWMALPAFLHYTKTRKKLRYAIIAAWILSVAAAFTYGAVRLQTNPTTYRDDTMAIIIQPDLKPEQKMDASSGQDMFNLHVMLTIEAFRNLDVTPNTKTVTVIWPETALDEHLVVSVPEAETSLAGALSGHPYKVELVTGLWRQGERKANGRPSYYNSIALISARDGKLQVDDMYDKHHLVPFGEFLPMEQLLGLTPLVGFAGFEWGTGTKVLSAPGVPPVSPMICFEAIFPWYGASEGADWLVNTSNDGWYKDTPGPYQHLAMTQFRAIEQGKPIMRSATTGISAVIDPYGRIVKGLPYYQQGYINSAFPTKIMDGTLYTRFGESLFFLVLGLGLAAFWHLRFR